MNFPNVISLARLLSAPLGVWLILNHQFAAAFWLFVAAGFSDALDGFIAKHFNQVTALGELLDPVADKALIVSIAVTLGLEGYLPDWVVLLVAFRDILIVGGYLMALAVTRPPRWRPNSVSKVNTVLQIALITLVLAHLGLGLADYGMTMPLALAVGATTVFSGALYLARWMRIFAGAEEPGE
jgi:cardiolipin synthase